STDSSASPETVSALRNEDRHRRQRGHHPDLPRARELPAVRTPAERLVVQNVGGAPAIARLVTNLTHFCRALQNPRHRIPHTLQGAASERGSLMERVGAALRVLGLIVLLPAGAFAQASITGVVKDASGAVLPGVTVEAASPVLIEKVRTAVTDGTGQFRIVDLR